MSIDNNYLNVITEDNITPKRNSMNQFGNCRYLHYTLHIGLYNHFQRHTDIWEQLELLNQKNLYDYKN